ncbi:hypothetical protein PRIPAC_92955 [Pristionchus pacificus]|uniref:ShK domain-containing protein n=1 Tax=Pristionchus pacificus TaxID=54126 RepID=A0A2A6CDU3_PRIPA|nr:hypothetical protein PRIPAC_92955 [Pristionchus pacificus]|eukprot:PDM76286.1 ShK domain-containing protein [Pristionchus pacificus]
MNRSLLISAGVLSMVVLASGQCALSDHPNCASWVRNGFCVNSAYSVQMKQQYCPKSCPEAGCSGGGQCALSDHPNCANWVRNGFCVNSAYSVQMKQQYCPKSCPEAGCSGGGAATTTAPKVQNANCKKWNEDPANVFCGNEKITADQKKIFCFDTCKAEIANTDNCAVYIQATGATTVTRKAAAGTVAPAPATSTATTTGDKILHAFAKQKCKVDVYDIAAPVLPPTANPTAPKQTCDGTAADKFCKIDAANQAALSYVCSCTA